MVLLRNNSHASSKMASAMALNVVASRKLTGARNTSATSTQTQYAIKRRSMSGGAMTVPRRKRPRTSWGKPHSNPAVLVVCSSIFVKAEAAASSTSACDEDYATGAASSCITMPFSCEATSFIKTEPLQHLQAAVKLEVESYDDCPLHQVPTFFPAMEHLLTTGPTAAEDFEKQLSRCAHIFPPLSSLPWPVSPLSSSTATDEFSGEHLCSSITDELSGDDMVNWDDDFHEESCEFLSERFYEIEKDMSCIMGDAAVQPRQVDGIRDQRCIKKQTASTEISWVSREAMQMETERVKVEAFDSSTGGGEEEYRIDLVDFEPDQGAGAGEQNHVDGHQVRWRKLALTLDYEDVRSAWKGPLFADGSCPSRATSPDDYALDLAAWEPENQTSLSLDEALLLPEASKMIIITSPSPDDGTCVGDDGDGIGAARHARVLRYREKRRTRLFSKKIRYEVRKLNAERRPRMKGRFIKRTMG